MTRDDQGVAESVARYQVIPRTLCFITHDGDVLLLRGGPHKRLWAGLYNGVGGHVEPQEDIYTAALREVQEETGLTIQDVRLCGVVHVDTGDPVVGILFFVFTAVTTNRDTTPSGEGVLEWWPITALPREGLVEDLPLLLPKALAQGRESPPFFALYRYDANNRLVASFVAPG